MARGFRGRSITWELDRMDGEPAEPAPAPAHARRCEAHGVWFRGPLCSLCLAYAQQQRAAKALDTGGSVGGSLPGLAARTGG